jgi:hypothetical protein
VVFTYLEGRRSTELLASATNAAIIFGGALARAVGSAILDVLPTEKQVCAGDDATTSPKTVCVVVLGWWRLSSEPLAARRRTSCGPSAYLLRPVGVPLAARRSSSCGPSAYLLRPVGVPLAALSMAVVYPFVLTVACRLFSGANLSPSTVARAQHGSITADSF